ncbi:general odorant-binding protein 69a [Diachasma alloeum]|uniref:Odorant binding protein 8 n=1 Tax=Diachasma alloeum TaxID=454923 RepID=A0A4E0S3X3_9HYME|nr:general odorant-binding protein 69a [Diachasma alloeum]THK33255.1 odorant binding protein 8 [Diachasma alloeum]
MNTSATVLVFCALAVTLVLGHHPKPMFAAAAEKCIEKTGVDLDALKTLHETGGVNADEKLKCFGACIMKGLGVMAEDGTVDVEAAKELVPSDVPDRDKIVAVIEACHHEKGANECETAHAIGMCMHKNHMNDMQN